MEVGCGQRHGKRTAADAFSWRSPSETDERRTVVVGVRRVGGGEGVAVERGAQAHRANLVFDLERLDGQVDAGFDGELALGADDGRACSCRTGGACAAGAGVGPGPGNRHGEVHRKRTGANQVSGVCKGREWVSAGMNARV